MGENIQYLIKNNFKLLISLDGPKSEHDKFRIDQKNQETHNKIWRNIKRIRELNTDFFEKNVSFNSVYCEFHNLNRINDFFEKSLFNKNVIQVGKASGLDENFYQTIEQKFPYNKQIYKRKYNELHQLYIESILKKKPASKYISSLFVPYFSQLKHRKYINYMDRLNGIKNGYTFSCFPGKVRLFVDTDGKYHICERMNKHFDIGNCDNGIEYKKVEGIINEYYQQIGKECIFCEAVNICQSCFASFCAKKRFIQNDICRKTKESLRNILKNYVTILEYNLDVF